MSRDPRAGDKGYELSALYRPDGSVDPHGCREDFEIEKVDPDGWVTVHVTSVTVKGRGAEAQDRRYDTVLELFTNEPHEMTANKPAETEFHGEWEN